MRVILARDYVSNDGKKAKADATVDLPNHEARNLIHVGLARPAEDTKADDSTTPKKEAN